MTVVADPIMVMVRRNAYLRPILSPSLPKTSAPKGLTAKPAAKVPR